MQGGADPPFQIRCGAAAVWNVDAQARMPVEHTAVDQLRDSRRFVVRKADHQIEVPAPCRRLPVQRQFDVDGRWVDHHRHVKRFVRGPEGIERTIRQFHFAKLAAKVRTDQSRLGNCALQFRDGGSHILHRQLGETREA